MYKHSLALSALLVVVGSCGQDSGPGGNGGAQFEPQVNSELAPVQSSIADGQGNPQPIAASVDSRGVQSDFLEGVAVVQPASEAELTEFLERYGGVVVGDDTIPEPPPELGITLTPEQRKATTYVVRLDVTRVDAAEFAARGAAIGLTGALEFSSTKGLQTMAVVADAVAAGFRAWPDYVDYSAADFPMTLLKSEERQDPVTGLYASAFDTTRFQSTGSQSNVTLAWQFLAAHGIASEGGAQKAVYVAVIDDGFWLNSDGTSRGTDNDFPDHPIQQDFVSNDAIADGPNTTGCGPGNPCYWHGNGTADIATGIINNRAGAAGTGGLVARPMLLKAGTRPQWIAAVRAAVAFDADVVSMSYGGDCNDCCREFFQDNSPFDAALRRGSRTVFVASAGNGQLPAGAPAGTPNVGFDVGDPHYSVPCTLDHVICVGALNDDLTTKVGYSNFGADVDIFAPTNIPVVTTPAGNDPNPAGPTLPLPVSFSGTSASAPFVAGVVAMMKGINPELNTDDVATILRDTAHAGIAPVDRYLDAYAAVRAAAAGIPAVPDRLEGFNHANDQTPTQLTGFGPHDLTNLNLDSSADRDYFRLESPGGSTMTITLQYPEGLGPISIFSLQSLDDACGAPTLVSDVGLGGTGRTLTFTTPGGPLQLGLSAGDLNAYNLAISFNAAALLPDIYEVGGNDDVAHAKYIHGFAPGTGTFGAEFVIDPTVTIQANIHDANDIDYYVVRGDRLSQGEAALLLGSASVRVYVNDTPISLQVYGLNADQTQGDLVAERSGGACLSEALVVPLQSDVYYLVRVAGGVGRYTLFNGALADPLRLPPILAGGFPGEIIQPGPVEIERELRFEKTFVFLADPAFDTVVSNNPAVHLSLFALGGELLAEGAASEAGERLSIANLQATQGYALLAEPTDLSAGPLTLRLEWEPAAPVRASENLIANPGAEIAVGPDPDQFIPYWDIESAPSTLVYGGEPGNPSLADPGPADRGLSFFAGGIDNSSSAILQAIEVDPAWQEAINAGRVKFRFAAFLGGNLQQADSASGRLIFRNSSSDGGVISEISLPAVTPLDRAGQTGLFPVEVNDHVPADTTMMIVEVRFTGGQGNFNDGYADNLELVLSEYPQ